MNDHWILTASGRKFHYGVDNQHEYHLPDIAAALSRICRFTGHLKALYADSIFSVAQHSVYVLRILQKKKAPEKTWKWGLTHDAPEAYFGDMNSPFKRLLPGYVAHEDHGAVLFRRQYGIPYSDEIEAYVKWADHQAYFAESKMLTEIDMAPDAWIHANEIEFTLRDIDPEFYPWRPKKARDEYLASCEELNIRRL